jgi:hemoglobin/transferrin/lactoferrin receptor protein
MVCKYTFTGVAFFALFPAWTQNIEKLSSQDLNKQINIYEQKVISASRSEKKISDLPITIYVVTKEQIQQNAYRSLVELLQDIPSIRTSPAGNGQEGELFSLRGFRGNYYVKILLNGIPINPSATLGMPIGEQLPIQQAERIEIIQGAASSIYGADALAGVINIITQNPEDNTIVQAGVSIGQFGYQNTHFLVGSTLSFGKKMPQSLEYSIFGNFSKQNDLNLAKNNSVWNPQNYNSDFAGGIPAYTPFYRGTNEQPEIGNMPRQAYSFGINLKYKKWSLGYLEMYRREHSSLGQSTASYFYYNPEIFWGENIRRLSAIHLQEKGKLSFTTNLSWLNYRLDPQSSFALTFEGGDQGRQYKYAASDDLFAEQLITYKINENLEITSGLTGKFSGNLPKTNDLPRPIDTRAYRAFATDIPLSDTLFGKFGYNPFVFYQLAGFSQAYYNKKNLTIIAGIRYDYQSVYKGSLNPRLAFGYKATEKISLRSSWGTGFKPPTPNNTYNSVAIPAGNGLIRYIFIPNPDLKPELANNFEIATRIAFRKNINLELIAFQNKLTALADPREVALDPALYPNSVSTTSIAYQNDREAFSRIRAVVASLSINELGKMRLQSLLNIQYTTGTESLPNKEGTINIFKEMPRWMLQWQIALQPTPQTFLRISNHFLSSWYARDVFSIAQFEDPSNLINGYYVIHLTAGLYPSKNFQLYCKVANVFNRHYAGLSAYGTGDLLFNPQPLRQVQIGCNFNFR